MLCSDFSKDWFIFHLDGNGYKHVQPNHYDRYRNWVFNSYNVKRDEDDGLKWNTCHQGRHTLKSYLKDCGIPDTDADTVMGNGKEKSHGSGNIYRHITMEGENKIRDAMEVVLQKRFKMKE